MDNSVERNKRIEEIQKEKERTDRSFELVTTDINKADEWIYLLVDEISRLQVERDKAIEENERMKIALHNIYHTETKGSLADLHGAMAAIKTIAHIGLGVSHDPLD